MTKTNKIVDLINKINNYFNENNLYCDVCWA